MKKTNEIFDQRNERKKYIEFSTHRKKSINEWQLWRYYCWINIAKEISKYTPFKRPCLIISSNMWYEMVWIIPILWQKPNILSKFYHEIINRINYGLSKPSYFIFNQFKIISTVRLTQKINDNKDFWLFPIFDIKQKLKNLI